MTIGDCSRKNHILAFTERVIEKYLFKNKYLKEDVVAFHGETQNAII